MKKILAVAGIATLLMAAAPVTAEAAPRDHSQRSHNSGRDHRSDNSGRSHDASRSTRHDRAERRVENRQRDVHRHREVRREHVARRHQRREFNHWRPGLERAHYRHFSAPVYHNGYYRVRAHDHHDRLVLLTISAITGAIVVSSY
ncbi:MAG: hypothetical protein WA138_11780 [Parvibaculum sp.]